MHPYPTQMLAAEHMADLRREADELRSTVVPRLGFADRWAGALERLAARLHRPVAPGVACCPA